MHHLPGSFRPGFSNLLSPLAWKQNHTLCKVMAKSCQTAAEQETTIKLLYIVKTRTD